MAASVIAAARRHIDREVAREEARLLHVAVMGLRGRLLDTADSRKTSLAWAAELKLASVLLSGNSVVYLDAHGPRVFAKRGVEFARRLTDELRSKQLLDPAVDIVWIGVFGAEHFTKGLCFTNHTTNI